MPASSHPVEQAVQHVGVALVSRSFVTGEIVAQLIGERSTARLTASQDEAEQTNCGSDRKRPRRHPAAPPLVIESSLGPRRCCRRSAPGDLLVPTCYAAVNATPSMTGAPLTRRIVSVPVLVPNVGSTSRRRYLTTDDVRLTVPT